MGRIEDKLAETLELWPVENLTPYERNARTHSDEQVDQIAASMTEFGFTNPILVDGDSGIIAGHGRLMAAKRLGISRVPVVKLPHLTDEQKRAYVIADNKLAEQAGWDQALLRKELTTLRDDDFDLTLTGFTDEELAGLLPDPEEAPPGEGSEDQVPDIPKDPVSKPGDLWILGEHRVLCGDATNVQHVERLMGGEKTDMVFTDPPYGVSYEQGKFTGSQPKNKFKPIENDEKRGRDLYNFIYDVFVCAGVASREGTVFYVWSPPLEEGTMIFHGVKDSGVHIQSQLIWNKQRLILGRADYHWQHEICWYGYRGKNHYWCGDRKQTSVWDFSRDTDYIHPTQKPVGLAELGCRNSTKSKNIVLDLFLGSGSTLIACEKTNRKCFGMEIDPHYCDVIVERWQEYSGKKSMLESGEAFDELKTKRDE